MIANKPVYINGDGETSPDFDEIKKLLKNPLFFDGRNQFKQQRMEAMGFEYIQIGVTA